MEQNKCPLCQREIWLLPDIDPFDLRTLVIHYHFRPPSAETPVRPGTDGVCLGAGLGLALARAVAEDRRAGVHLKAHP